MAFTVEFVPPVEEETSEFLRQARKTLNTGWSKWNSWVVDRERQMVLFRRGGGHQPCSIDEDYWFFIDPKGFYSASTRLLSEMEISPEEIAVTRTVFFQKGVGLSNPDSDTLSAMKEALRAYKDSGTASKYRICRLTLIDPVSGKEI